MHYEYTYNVYYTKVNVKNIENFRHWSATVSR